MGAAGVYSASARAFGWRAGAASAAIFSAVGAPTGATGGNASFVGGAHAQERRDERRRRDSQHQTNRGNQRTHYLLSYFPTQNGGPN